jgi:hypothetical protein
MNKIVFVQIYSCIEGKLVKEYRYALKENVFVNAVEGIFVRDECMRVSVTTYGLKRVFIDVCPYQEVESVTELPSGASNFL